MIVWSPTILSGPGSGVQLLIATNKQFMAILWSSGTGAVIIIAFQFLSISSKLESNKGLESKWGDHGPDAFRTLGKQIDHWSVLWCAMTQLTQFETVTIPDSYMALYLLCSRKNQQGERHCTFKWLYFLCKKPAARWHCCQNGCCFVTFKGFKQHICV